MIYEIINEIINADNRLQSKSETSAIPNLV